MHVCSPFFGGSKVPMQVFARPILKVQPAFFIVFLLGCPGTLDSLDEAVVSSRYSRSKLFPSLSQEPSQAKIHKSSAAILADVWRRYRFLLSPSQPIFG